MREISSLIVATRVSAALARSARGRQRRVREVATDAIRLAAHAAAVRAALLRQKSAGRRLAIIRRIAHVYGADVVYRADVHTMVVGLKFRDKSYRSGVHDILFVA